MRDHGGNLDAAIARFGAGDWIDLSTGINRRPYPVPEIPPAAWLSLPTISAKAALVQAARAAWAVAPGVAGLALAGAQAVIQMVPHLMPKGDARVLAPTYNEHAASLRAQGWQVSECAGLEDLAGAGLAILVNPNNPDGRRWPAAQLLELSRKVGFLVVDESFADATPELSLLPMAGQENLLILRSFGKFYGLAGLRLGFAFGGSGVIARMADLAGPWPVSGPAIHLGCRALADTAWAKAMQAQLASDATRADAMASAAGWRVLGGTVLFRLYEVPDATAAQDHLARHHIWSRIFPFSDRWLRLGLPGAEGEWDRLAQVLR